MPILNLFFRLLDIISPFILPIIFIFSSIIIGITFEFIIRKKLEKLAKKTKWQGDDIIIKSLKGLLLVWILILGSYLALINLQLKDNIVKIIQKILIIISIFSITLFITKVAVNFFNLYSNKIGRKIPSASIFENIIKFTLIIIGTLIILNYLGISITPIITALGIGGLAVALALQDSLSNLFAGLQILMSHQIKPGDYIRLETGEEGYIVDITWRNTTIKQLSNNMIVIPNSKVSNTIILNYNLPDKEFTFIVNVGVSYKSDLEKVEKITIEVAKETMKQVPGGDPNFEPFIRYHTFGDFSINFSVILKVTEFSFQNPIKHEFIKRLHKRYIQENIEIPFPITTVYIKK